MSKQRETSFKEVFIGHVKKLKNTWYIKTQEVGRSGTPDLLMCVAGHFVAIELKVIDGKESALQSFNIERINSCGGIGLVVNDENYMECIRKLKKLSGGKRDKTEV